MAAMNEAKAKENEPTTKWVPIKTSAGEITGYIEMFWGGHLGWVTVPGASRFKEGMKSADDENGVRS